MTSSWFFLSTLNYDARSTTHQIHEGVNWSQQQEPLRRSLNPVHRTLKSYLSNINFNTILPVKLTHTIPPCSLFPADIPTKILYVLFIYHKHAVCPAHITVIWFRLPFSKTWIRNIRTSPLYAHQRLYPRITKDIQQGWPNLTVLRACRKIQNFFAGASRYMMVHISWKISNKIQYIHKIHFYLVKQWHTKRCLTLITEWSDRTT